MIRPPPATSAERVQLDAALIRKVAGGDAKAARSLVDAHLATITRFAFRMLGDSSEAEDVAQESFLRLWRQADQWQPRASISTWLHQVAHNLCVDRLRTRRPVGDDSVDQPDSQLPAPAQLEQHEQSKAVQRALSQLTERQRAAVALVYFEGMSNQQAAEVLGVHVDALESLLVRARQSLRQQLLEKPLPAREKLP